MVSVPSNLHAYNSFCPLVSYFVVYFLIVTLNFFLQQGLARHLNQVHSEQASTKTTKPKKVRYNNNNNNSNTVIINNNNN